MRTSPGSLPTPFTSWRDSSIYVALTELENSSTPIGCRPEASAVGRAIRLAESTYCSGSAMFSKTAKITNTFRILPG